MNIKTICYFGDYRPQYIRNDVIINGLVKNGVHLLICHSSSRGFLRFFSLVKQYISYGRKCDLVIVGSSDSSRPLVLLARIISRKFLIWDAHYSIYDTLVLDRKLARPGSIKAYYYWFLDWMGCVLADKILLDTNSHIKYFAKTFGVKREKFIRILVGANEELLRKYLGEPSNIRGVKLDGQFLISFHGNYIPLQGIEYIIRAAKILEQYPDIRFNLIGGGQTEKKMKDLAKNISIANINFIDKVSYSEVAHYLEISDISLGIFADTDKAARVIPNKIYEAMALGKPIITADTSGIRELFEDRKNILLCRPADEEDLARKILELRGNKSLLDSIGQEAYKLFEEKCRPEIVVRPILGLKFK